METKDILQWCERISAIAVQCVYKFEIQINKHGNNSERVLRLNSHLGASIIVGVD